ncbi:LUD domain-containing protein [Sphingomonas aestuarii]
MPATVHHASPGIAWSKVPPALAQPSDGGVVIAQAVAAVAETRTLVIDTGPNCPMLPHFLAVHHIVIVRTNDLVAQLEDIPEPAAIPRSRFWITGVSGTTDIKGQYVRGAHGPRFLHVILVG